MLEELKILLFFELLILLIFIEFSLGLYTYKGIVEDILSFFLARRS
jgi:hypothetical protein